MNSSNENEFVKHEEWTPENRLLKNYWMTILTLQ